MPRAKRHAHRYEKRDLGWLGKTWICNLPECTHYMPHHLEKMLPGKQAQCNECDNVYILTKEKLQSEQPICDECETEHLLRMRSLREKKQSEPNIDELAKLIK